MILLVIFLTVYFTQIAISVGMLIFEDDFFESKKEFLQTLSPFYLIRLAIRAYKNLG
jgi:hypothetical protein